mmetsp:Transcript_4285/g.4402  ORF Transcript_4285/g.4402 Transcript_4285/m.4402 type:complete len:560 (+) Transcript_4285:1-1680(+)
MHDEKTLSCVIQDLDMDNLPPDTFSDNYESEVNAIESDIATTARHYADLQCTLDIPTHVVATTDIHETTPNNITQSKTSSSDSGVAAVNDNDTNVWLSIALQAESARSGDADDTYWETLTQKIRTAAKCTRLLMDDKEKEEKLKQTMICSSDNKDTSTTCKSNDDIEENGTTVLQSSYPFTSFSSPPWHIYPCENSDFYFDIPTPIISTTETGEVCSELNSLYHPDIETKLAEKEENMRIDFLLDVTNTIKTENIENDNENSGNVLSQLTSSWWSDIHKKTNNLLQSDKSIRLAFDHVVYELPGAKCGHNHIQKSESKSLATNHKTSLTRTDSVMEDPTVSAACHPEHQVARGKGTGKPLKTSDGVKGSKKKKIKSKSSSGHPSQVDLYQIMQSLDDNMFLENISTTEIGTETERHESSVRDDEREKEVLSDERKSEEQGVQEKVGSGDAPIPPQLLVSAVTARKGYHQTVKDYAVERKKKEAEEIEVSKARRVALLQENKILMEQDRERRLAELRREEVELEEYFRTTTVDKESEREKTRRKAIEDAKAKMRVKRTAR